MNMTKLTNQERAEVEPRGLAPIGTATVLVIETVKPAPIERAVMAARIRQMWAATGRPSHRPRI